MTTAWRRRSARRFEEPVVMTRWADALFLGFASIVFVTFLVFLGWNVVRLMVARGAL